MNYNSLLDNSQTQSGVKEWQMHHKDTLSKNFFLQINYLLLLDILNMSNRLGPQNSFFVNQTE